MGIFSHLPTGPSGFSYPYPIEQSCRFNAPDSAYLQKTFSTGDRKTWSYSTWFKVKGTAGTQEITFLGNILSGTDHHYISMHNGKLLVYAVISSVDYGKYYNILLRDPSSWYHLLVVWDTTQATASDRLKTYVNGSRITDVTVDYGDAPQNYEGYMNQAASHDICLNDDSVTYSDGYLAETHFIDGQALDVSDFGELHNGIWVPKALDITIEDTDITSEFSTLTEAASYPYDTFTQTGLVITEATQLDAVRSSCHTEGFAYSPNKYYKITYDYDLTFGVANYIHLSATDDGGGDRSNNVLLENGVGKIAYLNPTSAGTWFLSIFNNPSIMCTYSFELISVEEIEGYGLNGFYLDYSNSSHFGEDQSIGTDTDETSDYTSWINSSNPWDTFVSSGLDISNAVDAVNGIAYTTESLVVGIGDTFKITGDFTVSAGDGIRMGIVDSGVSEWKSQYYDVVSTGSYEFEVTVHIAGTWHFGFQSIAGTTGALANLTISRVEGNHFFDSGLATNDQVEDSPTKNFCTFNGVAPEIDPQSSRVLSNGNLDVFIPTDSLGGAVSTWLMTSGKWYWEMTVSAIGTTALYPGIAYGGMPIDGLHGSYPAAGSACYISNGNKYINQVSTGYGDSYTTPDTIGFALDVDGQTIEFFKNNVSQGELDISSIDTGTGWYAALTDGTSSAGGSITLWDFGQLGFTYTPPAGFLALNSANMPAPEILEGNKGFDIALYTGDRQDDNQITGLGLSPDLVWIKNRSSDNSHGLFDTVRGATAGLSTDLDEMELVGHNSLISFDSDGFTLDDDSVHQLVNYGLGDSYVAWNWKESPAYGFDIVAYEGTGIVHTEAHSLGVAPEMIIIKNRDTARDWAVYHHGVNGGVTPEDFYLRLNLTNAATDSDLLWNDTAPTSSVFTVGANSRVNTDDDSYIAYLFASIEGYSKVFSYTGNGLADGPFVHCGFRPRYILIKSTNTVEHWPVMDTARDPYNAQTHLLYTNLNIADEIGGGASGNDILSNGFKIRTTHNANNKSGDTYIGLAIAEHPFKYANAR
jgi:hypothetical protein